MKKILIILIVLATAFTAYHFLKPELSEVPTTGLPWQIDVRDDGTSDVFGINLGATTFKEAATQFGIDYEIAVMIDQQDNANLEMYYSHFKSGPLAGKLVISAKADPSMVTYLAENAIESEYLGTGARKFTLAQDMMNIGETLLVSDLTFLPTASLDAEVIEKLFGKPDQIINRGESHHYLYAAKGVDVILNDKGKETLQYIAPRDFHRLLVPLEQEASQTSSE